MNGWQWLRREWRGGRSGDLSILAVALAMSVAIVAGIGLFAERLERALDAQAATYLAGDLAVNSGKSLPDNLITAAQSRGLKTSQTIQFPTMAYPVSDDTNGILVSIKAVSSDYPLRGELEYKPGFEPPLTNYGLLASGTALVDQTYLDRAQLSVGDSIYVGELVVKVVGIIDREPDGGFSLFSLGPRVMISMVDVYSTMALRPGSRLSYAQQYAGDEAAISDFATWLEAEVNEDDVSIRTLEQGQPQLARTLARAKQFLLLCGALGVAMAGVALALAGRRYSRYLLDAVAVKKTLGATPKRITRLLVEKLAALWLLSTAAGLLIALVVQAGISALISAWLETELPAPTLLGAWLGILTSLISMVAFLGPPIYQLRAVPPLRVIRRELGGTGSLLSASVIGISAFSLLLVLYTETPWVIVGLLGALVLGGGVAWLLAIILFSGKRRLVQASSPWRLAMSSLARHRWLTVGQIVAFALTLSLLASAVLVRSSLIGDWQASIPEDAPNHFFTNVAPYQVDNINHTFDYENIDDSGLYAMVRGRIALINGEDAKARAEQNGYRHISRELNLSYASELPRDNELVVGSWWEPDTDQLLVSVEESVATRMNLKLADTITFDIGGTQVKVMVANIRTLDWDDLRPAFFMLLSPPALENFGASWMTSAYVPEERTDFIPAFLREFATVTVIDVGYIIEQVRQVINQVSRAVELVLGLVAVSAILVLLATVRSSQDWRLRESAVLRALGASKKRLLGALLIEFGFLGFAAGILGAAMAEGAAAVIQTQQFDLPMAWHWPMWIILPIGSALVVALFGLLTSKQVVQVAPNDILREVN
ncbi:MAG: FtsX-like permease family protein [Pseudomonadales bacterium]